MPNWDKYSLFDVIDADASIRRRHRYYETQIEFLRQQAEQTAVLKLQFQELLFAAEKFVTNPFYGSRDMDLQEACLTARQQLGLPKHD